MNQFFGRVGLSFIFIIILNSGLGAQSWSVPPSAATPLATIAGPAALATVVVPVSTVISPLTPVITSLVMVVPEQVVTPKPTAKTQATSELPEVVITANRLDTPANEVTSSVSVLTAKALEQKQADTMLSALQGLPGLDISQNGQPGQVSSIYIRGANPEHTLVLMDGIPLNDPNGAPYAFPYMDGISLDDVKQVEVVRGPQSTLWGSNAIGGVINIIPQSGPGPWGGSVLVEGGSYGTSRESVSAQGGDKGGYFNVNASHFNTAGFPSLDPKYGGTVNNGDDNNTASLRLGSNLADNLEEKVFVRYNQANTSLDANNSSYLFADDPNFFALQKQFMAASHTNWKLLGGSWEQVLNVSFYDDNRLYNGVSNVYNTYYDQANYDSQTGQVSWQNNVHLAKEETLVVGIQGQQQWVVSSDASGYSDTGANMPSVQPVTTVDTLSGFAESNTNLEERLFLNLGGRWDDHSQYGVHTTYQVGLAYFVPVLDTKLKANYGTGFLAPSLYQLYAPTYGNAALLPETSVGYDVGFEQAVGGKDLNIGASYFNNDLTNLIQYTNTYSNIGKARTYGVESFLEFQGMKNLDLKGSYTYTNSQDVVANTPLFKRPQNKASGDVDYQLDNAGFGASLIYVGTSLDQNYVTGSGETVTIPSYVVVNLRASYQVNPQVKIFARVDNLFNQWYEEVFGYATPGLSAYGGTKISF